MAWRKSRRSIQSEIMVLNLWVLQINWKRAWVRWNNNKWYVIFIRLGPTGWLGMRTYLQLHMWEEFGNAKLSQQELSFMLYWEHIDVAWKSKYWEHWRQHRTQIEPKLNSRLLKLYTMNDVNNEIQLSPKSFLTCVFFQHFWHAFVHRFLLMFCIGLHYDFL